MPEVNRLALAGRGSYGASIAEDDVRHALDRGINALIWAGTSDAIARVVAALTSKRREEIAVIAYLEGRTAGEAGPEIDAVLAMLGTPYLDVLLHGYVETTDEWTRIAGPGGAGEAVERARRAGKIRLAGLSTHQRQLAAAILGGTGTSPKAAGTSPVDVIKIRYNAAHRGAETQVLPAANRAGVPVITFTAQRWGALNARTPADPPGFNLPQPREWYRFALSHPGAALVATAPANRAELDHALSLLDDWRPAGDAELVVLRAHGDRVRAHTGSFT